MKRLLGIALLLVGLGVGGCEIVVSGGSYDLDSVTIRNASYRTDTRAVVSGTERFVICDDRVTSLSYRFDYEGPLTRWTSYLRGVYTGDVVGRQSFVPGAEGVTFDPHHVSVTYDIHPGVAPLEADPEDAVRPQGIDVVPVPDVIGYTRLYLELESSSSARRLGSADIPVLSNCRS